MNHSVKANLALRRGRNNLFDRSVAGSYGNWDNIVEPAKAPMQVREKFARKLEEERRTDVVKLLLSVLLTIGLIVGLYFYGEVLYRLIVHQVGQP